jgi:hypothetical protein
MKRHDRHMDGLELRGSRKDARSVADEIEVNRAYEGAWVCIDDLLRLERTAPTPHGRQSATQRLNLLRGQISSHND